MRSFFRLRTFIVLFFRDQHARAVLAWWACLLVRPCVGLPAHDAVAAEFEPQVRKVYGEPQHR